jgi:DNA polymerase zeta
VSPNGFMFVKAGVRKSLLAKMLSELLDTRVMVKEGMKGASGHKVRSRVHSRALTDDWWQALLKLLNARQLALKFLANVRRYLPCR